MALSDGRVIVRTGQASDPPVIYDSNSNEWTTVAGIMRNTGMSGIGNWFELPDNRLLAIGGRWIQFLDLGSGEWSDGPTLSGSDSLISFALGDSAVLAIDTGNGSEQDWLYDIEMNTWTQIPSAFQSEVYIHANQEPVKVGDGRYLFSGVFSGWILDLNNLDWKQTAPLGEARRGGRMTGLPDETALVYSGESQINSRRSPTETIEQYDPTQDSWSSWPPASKLDEDLFMISAWLLDGEGAIVGEFVPRNFSETGPLTDRLGLYDPAQDAWTMFSAPESFVDWDIVVLGDHRLLAITQDGFGSDAKVSAWMTALP